MDGRVRHALCNHKVHHVTELDLMQNRANAALGEHLVVLAFQATNPNQMTDEEEP